MYSVKSITKNFQKHCTVSDVFSSSEVEKIIALEDLETFSSAVVGRRDEKPIYSVKDRDTKVQWITFGENSAWIFHRLADLIPKVNYDVFMHSLTHMENLQYSVYEENAHYDWHMDNWDDQLLRNIRKISYSVMLTDPNDYEGGELEIVPFGSIHKSVILKPPIGSIVFFDSSFAHKVHPVKKGVRKTLVSWVLGDCDVMAHFAQLNKDNIVINVIVVNNSELIDQNGIETEQKGIDFCKSIFGANTNWVQTSYNSKFRKKFAGIGMRYDKTFDEFVIPPGVDG